VACFHPLRGFRARRKNPTGKRSIVFSIREGFSDMPVILPCGQCIGCRLERSRQWAVRCVHEANMYYHNCFLTLTYSDKFLPKDRSLDYDAPVLFMKRLRKKFSKARFYMCGEYGEKYKRPHFHACLFGVGFSDAVPWSKSPSGELLYRSPTLEALWPHGFSSFGSVTFESAAYVARYVMKKVTGQLAVAHYSSLDPITGELISLTPEFNRMSLKPGIGAEWFRRYKSDVYNFDYVVVNGVKSKPPRYYDKLLSGTDPDTFEALELSRYLKVTPEVVADGSSARLAVREQVARARLGFKSRSLE